MSAIASENVPIPHARLPAGALVQPEKSAVLVRQMGDELILTERRGPAVLVFQIVFGGCALLVWVGWTIVGASLVARIVAQPNLDDILFAVPFFALWFFALLLLCAVFFGRSCMRLGPEGLVRTWTILVFRGQRRVCLGEIKGFTESGRTEQGVKIVTLGRSLRFRGGSRAERDWLIALLNGCLRTLQGGSTADGGSSANGGPRPPSDSEITLQLDRDCLVVVRRYRSCGGLVAMMTLNLFILNGGVAYLLLLSVKHFGWALGCLFLIPIEILGAVMLEAWLSALISPWRRREWVFHSEAITTRTSVLGFGRTHTFDPLRLGQVELRKGVQSRGWNPFRRDPDEEEDRSFALAFVDSGGWDTFVIGELTEGEARWMESELRAAIKGGLSGRTVLAGARGPLWDRWLDGQT